MQSSAVSSALLLLLRSPPRRPADMLLPSPVRALVFASAFSQAYTSKRHFTREPRLGISYAIGSRGRARRTQATTDRRCCNAFGSALSSRHASSQVVGPNISFNATVTCRGDNPAPGAAR
jgi:hypothetical protein